MAFTPRFQNDLFISYAHTDNADGWVATFEQKLRYRLREFDRNAQFAIWRDERLSGADVFTEEIYDQLKSSALLISILSPNGLAPGWCEQERQRFEREAERTGGFRVGNQVRILKVVKTLPPGDQHRQLYGTRAYEFYEVLEGSDRYRKFHPTSVEFDQKFEELAQDVWDLLNRLRDRAISPEPDLTVYVGPVIPRLKDWRVRIVDQLKAWNCRVVPEGFPAAATSAANDELDAALAASSFSVHCFGESRGLADADDVNRGILPLQRARVRGLDRLVFRTTAVDSAVEAALQARPDHTAEEHQTASAIDAPLQSLEDRIRALRDRPPAKELLPTLYVVCEPSDWNAGLQLKACIDGLRLYAVLLPIRDVKDESARLRVHRKDLKRSDAVLVYWGGAHEAWFRDRYFELIGTLKAQRRNRVPVLCVSSPPHPARIQYARPDLPFEQVPDLQCETIRPLVRYLHAVAKGSSR